MDPSVFLGTMMALVVVFVAARSEMQSLQIFRNWAGPLLVLGCTFATAIVCLRIGPLISMIRVFLRTLSGKMDNRATETIQEIMHLSEQLNEGKTLSELLPQVGNAFLRESLELMEKGSVSEGELVEILQKRIEVQNEMYLRYGHMFKTLGKFPPAFGLIGTSLGMIALLGGLGAPDSFKRIGPAMSMALLATFYGLVLANVFLIPFGENLSRASQEDLLVRRIVFDGVLLIKSQKHPVVVYEFLQSYLSPAQRNQLSKVA
jgi:chemotaxis protein MotA